RGDAELHQHRRRLLAGRADAEVRPRHDHVARPHPGGEIGPQVLQAVLGDDVEAELHHRAGRELVGIDLGRQPPDAVRGVTAHASTSRGSWICPRNADAAAVYGDARKTSVSLPPIRPRKLRAVVEMTRLPDGTRLPYPA